MWRIPLFFFEHPRKVLAAALAAAVLAVAAASGLSLDVSSEALIPPDSPQRRAQDEVTRLFGAEEAALVFAADPALFTPDRLAALRDVHDALAALPSVGRVDSLFSLPDLRDENGALPEDPAGLERLRRRVAAHPLYRGSVVSEQGTATILRLVLREGAGAVPPRALAGAIEAALAPRRSHFATLEAVGGPALRLRLEDTLRHDQWVILPITTLVLFVILALTLRSPLLAAIPIFNGALATALTLAAMAALGLPINLLNATLPALILVVGGMEDVHLLVEFRERMHEHGLEKLAVYETTERIGFAVLLNEVTTILGFASIGLGTLPVLRAFGIAAGIGMVLRFLVTLVVLPAILGLVARRLATPRTAGASEPGRAGRRVDAFVDHLHARPGWLMTVLGLVILAGLAALAGLPRGNDLIGFLGAGDPIARRVRAVEKEMSGTETLHLVVRGAPGDFAQPATLQRLRDLTADVRDDGGVDSATSLADVVAIANVTSFADLRGIAPYVTADRSAAEVVVRSARHDETGLLRLAGALRSDAARAGFDPAGILVAGSGLAAAEAARSITTAQAASLGGMVATLFVIVAVLFLSVRIALAAVAVNLVAVAAMFILMRLTGIPLNVGTCMIASITLGVVIDDTLHFLVRYSREVRVYKEEHAAIRAAAREEVLAALSTAAALAGGFAVLGFSGFVPVRQFGLLSAAVIVIAVVADVFMSPVLFARARVVTLWDLIGLPLRRVLIEESPIFAGLRPWQARRLVLASDLVVLKDGDPIGGPGPPPALYVVLDGAVDKRDGTGRVGPGGATDAAAAPVFAVGPTRVLALSRRSMDSLRRFSPSLAARLRANLAALPAARPGTRLGP